MLKSNKPLVFHFRVGKGDTISSKNGATVVFRPDQKRFGVALCCHKDRYCRRWGREIADHRAEHGDNRVRKGRFNCVVDYDGEMSLDAIRNAASLLVVDAVGAVDGNLLLQIAAKSCIR